MIAEALQFEIVDNAILEQARKVGRSGNAKSRPYFFGDRAAAEQVTPFQQQDLPASPSQVGRCHQAVVTSTDHDRIEPFRHFTLSEAL